MTIGFPITALCREFRIRRKAKIDPTASRLMRPVCGNCSFSDSSIAFDVKAPDSAPVKWPERKLRYSFKVRRLAPMVIASWRATSWIRNIGILGRANSRQFHPIISAPRHHHQRWMAKDASIMGLNMAITSYVHYLQDLKRVIDRIRDRPFEFDDADVQLALCKNGFGYRSRDRVKDGQLFSEHHMGALNIHDWQPDHDLVGRAEIDEFFELPEVFAYSDSALHTEKNPLSVAHWDATIGIVEIEVRERHFPSRRQRMLFAGFSDRIHAEFFLAVERDFIVHDNQPGTRLYEWRETVPNEEMFSTSMGLPNHSR